MTQGKMTDDEIQNTLRDAVQAAVDYVEADISDERVKATRYFEGECDVPYDEDRSKVVSTKCRDAVRGVKPSLMRVFLQAENVAEFVPRRPEEAQQAEQATKFVNWSFWENNGFRVLTDVMQDALVKKLGIAKAYYSSYEDQEIDDIQGIPPEVFAVISEDAEVLEYEEGDDGLVTAKIARTNDSGKLCIESVPPEEFFINAEARNLGEAYVVGHRTEARVTDLVAMGFAFEDVKDLGGLDTQEMDEEQYERNDYTQQDDDENANDPSMRKVLLTEAYMKMDVDGTGVAKLYQFICGGSNYEILSRELADDVPFALFEIDPEPHTVFGRSLVEILIQDQDQATSMLRGLLDNIRLSNSPGYAFNDQNGAVNQDDLMNNEAGRLVRCNGDPTGKLMPLSVPFTAGETMPAMQYFDEVIEQKTGVSRASLGLDAEALQQGTATAVNATVSGGQGQIEVMARNLAEGGMRRLFSLMLKLMVKNQDAETYMRINGEFVPVDPRSWNASMDLAVNVGLGTNRHEERAAVLRETLERQMGIWTQFGPTNGVVTLTNIRNTLADIQLLSGIKSTERYWQPMSPEREQMLMQQAQEAAQGQEQPDPSGGLIAAEQIKAQAKMQTDASKLQLEAQKAMAEEERKRRELAMDDDLDRDKMAQDLALKVAKILGQHGVQVNADAVRAEQAAPRNYGGR